MILLTTEAAAAASEAGSSAASAAGILIAVIAFTAAFICSGVLTYRIRMKSLGNPPKDDDSNKEE